MEKRKEVDLKVTCYRDREKTSKEQTERGNSRQGKPGEDSLGKSRLASYDLRRVTCVRNVI